MNLNAGLEKVAMLGRTYTYMTEILRCLAREEGQDLVEYGLVIALIAFSCITALKSVSTDICMIYSAISSTVASSVG